MENMARSSKSSPEETTAEPGDTKPKLRTDGADTSEARAAVAATSPESAEIGRLTSEVERLNRMVSNLNGLVDDKNRQIAVLEEQKANLTREVGRLTAEHVRTEAAPRGLTLVEFQDARKDGLANFVVLSDFKSRTRSARFNKGQGLDARQHPRMEEYLGQGLLLAPLPEGGA